MNINVTLLGEMITFGVLIFVTMKFIWPPITKAMDERQKKIADGLAAGARGEKNLELAQNKVKKELIAVKKDAVDIIDEANRRMAQIIDEAKAKADKEGKRILTAAQGDINKEMEAAKVEVKSYVAQLVITASEKFVAKNLDSQTNRELIAKIIAEI